MLSAWVSFLLKTQFLQPQKKSLKIADAVANGPLLFVTLYAIGLPGFTNFGKAPKGDTGHPPKSEALYKRHIDSGQNQSYHQIWMSRLPQKKSAIKCRTRIQMFSPSSLLDLHLDGTSFAWFATLGSLLLILTGHNLSKSSKRIKTQIADLLTPRSSKTRRSHRSHTCQSGQLSKCIYVYITLICRYAKS